MKPLFTCTMSFAGDGPVAYLDGELDMVTVQGLAERLSSQVQAGRTLTVNLSGITFIGSSGLKALADLQRRATACGGSLRLAEVPWLVSRLLEITGMQDGFVIERPTRRAESHGPAYRPGRRGGRITRHYRR